MTAINIAPVRIWCPPHRNLTDPMSIEDALQEIHYHLTEGEPGSHDGIAIVNVNFTIPEEPS